MLRVSTVQMHTSVRAHTIGRILSPMLLSAIAVVFLLPDMTTGWYRNNGNLRVLHSSGPTQPIFAISQRYAKSAHIALTYLDLANLALQSGDIRAASSFWKSAQTQSSDDFLVRYRTALLVRRFAGFHVRVSNALYERNIVWQGDFRLDTDLINMLVEKSIVQDAWLPTATGVIEIVSQFDRAEPEFYVYLSDSYFRGGYYQAAIGILNDLARRFQPREWQYLKMGQIHEIEATVRSADISLFENSLVSYQRAYQLAPSSPFAADRMVQINKQLSRNSLAQQWEDILKIQLAARQPEYPVNQRVSQEWTLIGYDLQEELLDMTGEAPACFWWSHSGGSNLSKWEGYWLSGSTLVQCYQVDNLLKNGSFEMDGRSGQMFPIGFGTDLYGASLGSHGLSPDPFGERSGTIAWLANTSSHRYTSFVSDSFGIDASATYLQGAWVKSPDGQAFLGRMWLLSADYSYITNGNPTTWTHWAGLAFPPAGTTATRVLLLNYDNEGTAYFDRLLFAKVRLPNAVSGQR